MTLIIRNQDNNSIIDTYGSQDLGSLDNFQGDYINFGYWKDILLQQNHISIEERIGASEALYDLIFEKLTPEANDDILEIGCGKGRGGARLLEHYQFGHYTGIDISEIQIKRTESLLKRLKLNHAKFDLMQSTAEMIPIPNNKFEKIYSVEVAQHFQQLSVIAQEIKRVLKPNGQLVITAHFSVDNNAYEKLRNKNLLVEENIDNLAPIALFLESLIKAGFKQVNCEGIGDHVFHGYEKWLTQIDCRTPWSHNIYTAYKQKLIDYYLITANA